MRKEAAKGNVVLAAVIVVAAAALVTLLSAAYTLDETEQAVILQFGAPIGEPVTTPGLHFKKPFIQEVRRFDKRVLAWDGDPNQIPTRGREFISVDTTARWKIVDPLKFLKSVRNETGAQSRLDDIIDSVVRDSISSTELTDIIRSRDWAVEEEKIEELAVPVEKKKEELKKKVRVGREKLTQDILKEAGKVMPSYGIELRDFRIKRINYISSVQKQVFDRMISERQRIAEGFRAEGEGKSQEIQGQTRREVQEIVSEAEREAQVIRGEAEAEATRIYNEAYSSDPEFYTFYRTLKSYRETVTDKTVLFLDADSEYLRFLNETGDAKAAQ
ncbi:protease modulator HflC [Kiritimatiella glycovorans]|uniref:Protein HflC n=1 Tax=Kiritimatiella glycovorans TaxID=1307763 RepID=A0A0G3EAJ3_9BACT|nr:protease modulator HflC [Kiritimatiella glycovorans]AKJ63471.1 Modulator of FtsH protease HflC [Kiritimatiella glycovorans]